MGEDLLCIVHDKIAPTRIRPSYVMSMGKIQTHVKSADGFSRDLSGLMDKAKDDKLIFRVSKSDKTNDKNKNYQQNKVYFTKSGEILKTRFLVSNQYKNM